MFNTMNNKLITATSKTDTHLVFDIRYSIPLTEVSEELANDVIEMLDKPFHLDIPVERHIDFFTDIDGKEKFNVSSQL